MDFDIWIKISNFHLIIKPDEFSFIYIKNGLFHYLIDWHKPEPTKAKPTTTDNSDPIPF